MKLHPNTVKELAEVIGEWFEITQREELIQDLMNRNIKEI